MQTGRRRARWTRPAAVLAVVAATLGLSVAADSSARTAEAACTVSVTLRSGSAGAGVRCVQSRLAALGYSPGPVDGRFGARTRAAVVAYQRAGGLVVDGVVGRQTAGALGIWGATTAPAGFTSAATAAPAGCAIAAAVRLGSSGAGVQCVQSRLSALGYSPGPLDGQFGPRTRAAVIAYQRAGGLFVDGVVGPRTGGSLGIWGAATGQPAPSSTPSPSGCRPPDGVPAGAGQVVVVTASGTMADVDLLVRRGAEWTCERMDMSGRVGRNGVRALAQRRSGDGTTPAGVFPLGSMQAPDGQTFQFFGNGADPGVPGSWRQVRAGDCWAATPGSAAYNTLVSRPAAQCTGEDEYLPNIVGAYSAAALIGANMGPDRSGDSPSEPALAAAIFLHRHSYDAAGNSKPTSGCVSLNATNLAAVLQTLVPGEAWFVIR